MKYEWKKQEKEIYGVKTKPCVIDIPAWKYIILSGNGNPNDEVKSGEITDYAVYPLEGIWNMATGVLAKSIVKFI